MTAAMKPRKDPNCCCCAKTVGCRFHDRNMAEPPQGELVAPSTNSKADDSNKVKQDDRSKNWVAAEPVCNRRKAKSCAGYLYYSSTLRADSQNPVCVGITRSLPGAPERTVGQAEIDASRKGSDLAGFSYKCYGYSIYTNQKDQSPDGRKSQTELPHCKGLEILDDHVGSQTVNYTSAPAHIRNKEDSNGLPQRHSPKPSNSSGEEFLPRITRSAKLVAKGVAKNARRVRNQIKQCFDDIVYPYRRPPK